MDVQLNNVLMKNIKPTNTNNLLPIKIEGSTENPFKELFNATLSTIGCTDNNNAVCIVDKSIGENIKLTENFIGNNTNENQINSISKNDTSIKGNNSIQKQTEVDEYKPTFDTKKAASDLNAIESDLKRIESKLQNGELKKEIQKLREEISSIRKKIEDGEITKDDVMKIASLMKTGVNLLKELSINNAETLRIYDLMNSISSQINRDLLTFNLDKLNSMIESLSKLFNDGNKVEKQNNNNKTSYKDIEVLIDKIKKLLDSEKTENSELTKQLENKLNKLNLLGKFDVDEINKAKIKDLISSINKLIDDASLISNLKVEIRDLRTIQKTLDKDTFMKNKKIEKTIENIINKSPSQNTSELKTEMIVKSTLETNQNVNNKNFASSLAKAENLSSTVDPKEVIGQLIKKASINLKNDKSEIVIQLKPESLGKVKLKLSVSESEVTGKITVENEDVKRIVQNHINELSKALEESGLKLSSFDISLGQELKDFQLQNGDIEFGSMKSENNKENTVNQSEKQEEQAQPELPEWLAGNINLRG